MTALHSVAGCDRIQLFATGPEGVVASANAVIREVDIARDVAILSIDTELPYVYQAQAATPPPGHAVRVEGFPLGLARPLEVTARLREQPLRALETLIPTKKFSWFDERNSPARGVQVASVEGHLTGGLSGAPVLVGNMPFGLVDGGLLGGTTEIGWAIPLADLELKPATGASSKEVERIGRLPIADLFSSKDVSPSDQVSCGGNIFRPVRSAMTFEDLVVRSEDRAAAEQLGLMYGMHGDPTEYTLYRSGSQEYELVLPANFVLSDQNGTCSAEKDGVQVQFVRFDMALEEATPKIFEREWTTLCSKGFAVDPSASNVAPRTNQKAGIVTLVRSYTRVERRCSQPGRWLDILDEPGWSSLNKPVFGTQGPEQCFYHCAGLAPYPDIWMGTVAARSDEAFIKRVAPMTADWAFSSFFSRPHASLVSTVSFSVPPDFVIEFAECQRTLSSTSTCRKIGAINRAYQSAVVAALASRVGGGLIAD